MSNWTISTDRLVKDLKIGDIVCLQSHGGAKVWAKYAGIVNKYSTIMREKRDYYQFDGYYYKSYYDKHLTGRSSGSIFLPVNNNTLTYPAKKCKR